METKNIKIGVIGAGSWGTALANLLALKGFAVDLWVFEEEVCRQISEQGENIDFLPEIKLSENIFPSNDIERAVAEKNFLLIATPSHVFRDTAQKMAEFLEKDAIVVSASKGIENKTRVTMSGIMKEIFLKISGKNLAVLSGPSFAREVGMRLPTVITAASADPETAAFVQRLFAAPYFRVYTSGDVIGAELGGAVKNVIAIAAGMADGMGLGLNARAALITRGLAEISRLGIKLGANSHTFAGPAGAGDLILTCTGNLSRNHTVGKKIGEGKKIEDILSGMRMVAEGVKTAKSVYNLSIKLGVEMPISHEIYRILYEDISPKEALKRLMSRDLRHELDDPLLWQTF